MTSVCVLFCVLICFKNLTEIKYITIYYYEKNMLKVVGADFT